VRAPGLPAENIARRGWFLVQINVAPSTRGQSLSSIALQNQLLWCPFSGLNFQRGKKFTSSIKFMPQQKFTHTTETTLDATGACSGQGPRPGGRLTPRTERRPGLPPQLPPPTHHRPLPGGEPPPGPPAAAPVQAACRPPSRGNAPPFRRSPRPPPTQPPEDIH